MMGIQDRQLTAAVKNLGQYTRTVLGRVEYNENAAGKSQGKAETIACRTCKAPADPPTTIMSLRPMALRLEWDTTSGGYGKRNSALLVRRRDPAVHSK